MNCLLALFFIMHSLHASATSQPLQDQLPKYENRSASPTLRSMSPVCEIIDDHFKLIPARQGLITAIAPILKDRKVMKFYGTGRPMGFKEVEGRVTRLEQQLYSEPDPTSRMWAIMTHKGVCGVLLFYPSKFNSIAQQVSEIARILSLSEQGKGLGRDVLNRLFDHFPHMAWSGKSHPKNIASRKSRENVGFKHVETRYDEQDRAIRIFDRRDSNNKIDSNTQIRFAYSGNTVSLASLAGELSLAELLSFTTEGTNVRPLTLQDLDQKNIRTIFVTHFENTLSFSMVQLVSNQEVSLKSTNINDLLQYLNVSLIYFGIFKKYSGNIIKMFSIQAIKSHPSDDLSKKLYKSLLMVDEKFRKLSYEKEKCRQEVEHAFHKHYQDHRFIPRRAVDSCSALFAGVIDSVAKSARAARMSSNSMHNRNTISTPGAAKPLTYVYYPMRLALYQPEIPQNVGTLIRLGACVGVPIDIIEPTGFVWSDKHLKRAGMDYADLANVERFESWDTYKNLQSAQRIVLLDTKAEQSFWDFAFQPDDILMIGRESSGVPEDVYQSIPSRVRIPMLPNRRSLNMAIAGAMVLAESLRQTQSDHSPHLR